MVGDPNGRLHEGPVGLGELHADFATDALTRAPFDVGPVGTVVFAWQTRSSRLLVARNVAAEIGQADIGR